MLNFISNDPHWVWLLMSFEKVNVVYLLPPVKTKRIVYICGATPPAKM
jgi:hypothetical protein